MKTLNLLILAQRETLQGENIVTSQIVTMKLISILICDKREAHIRENYHMDINKEQKEILNMNKASLGITYKEYQKQWRTANNEYQKVYYTENKEQLKQYQRDYYLKNKI